MTIGGWVAFSIMAVIFILFGSLGVFGFEGTAARIASGVASVAAVAITLVIMLWYYGNTASGQRAIVSQKSELSGGLQRTVTVYTADGEVIARYSGEIDIQGNDGGYVLFDFNGKRYTYYNCFVESIAEIEE